MYLKVDSEITLNTNLNHSSIVFTTHFNPQDNVSTIAHIRKIKVEGLCLFIKKGA